MTVWLYGHNMLCRTKEFGDLLQQYQDEIDTFREKEVWINSYMTSYAHKAQSLQLGLLHLYENFSIDL